MCCAVQIEEPSALFTALQSMVRDPSFDPQRAYSVARRRREDAMAEIEALLGVESIEYWQFRCAYLKNVFLVCAPCHTVLLSLHRVASCCAMLIWVVPCCTVLYRAVRSATTYTVLRLGSLCWARYRLYFSSKYYPVREEAVFYLGSCWPALRPMALELVSIHLRTMMETFIIILVCHHRTETKRADFTEMSSGQHSTARYQTVFRLLCARVYYRVVALSVTAS